MSNQGLITENQKLLEQLRRALEQAEGLDIVFEKHMEKKNGKYIVFCSGKEHMDEMKEQVSTWFRRVDREPRIYTAFYNDTATDREFREFKKDNSAHLKLLFCIDMLNEGVHVDDVDGVILLRPTVSPIIYLQQIGRALSAGSGKTPVIFDLVNNFDSLSCIDCLKKEMEEAFVLFPTTYGKGVRFSERFHITEETKDWQDAFPETADEFEFRLGDLLYCCKAVLPGEGESESSEELSDADRAYAGKLDSDAAQGPCRFGDRESE